MKFKYEEDKTETRKAVAKLYKMKGSDDKYCLWIKTNDRFQNIWLYDSGTPVTVQGEGPDEDSLPVKIFYEGDTIEITF